MKIYFTHAQFVLIGLLLLLFSLSMVGAASAETNRWQATYWNNSDLAGKPVLERSEPYLFYNWGKGSPARGTVNVDAFSARWTRTINVPSGTYRFDATADDGIRVYLDGNLLIDGWYNTSRQTTSNQIYLSANPHNIVVEYYEVGGEAIAQLTYDKVLSDQGDGGQAAGATQNGAWKGAYFANPNLRDAPVLVRDDAAIDFNWGTAAPAEGLPENGFSVRWDNTLTASAGRYRFTITVDDGARLYINDEILINSWKSAPVRTVSAEITLYDATIPIRMEYTEGIGEAQVSLTWTLLYTIGDVENNPPPDLEPVTATAIMRERTPMRQTFRDDAPLVGFAESGEQVTLAGTRNADATWIRIINAHSKWGWVSADSLITDYPLETLAVWEDDW